MAQLSHGFYTGGLLAWLQECVCLHSVIVCKSQAFSWPVVVLWPSEMLLPQRDFCFSACSLPPSLAAMFSSYFLEALTLLNYSFTWFFLSRDRKAGGPVWEERNALPLWLWQSFPLESLWPYFALIAPFPCPSYEIFLHSSLGETVRVPEGKHVRLWGAPETRAPRHFSFSHQLTISQYLFIKIILWVFLPAYGSTSFCARWAGIGCDSSNV